MTTEAIRQLVYSVYDAVNAKDAERFDELFAPDIIRHAMNQIGVAPAKAGLAAAFVDVPDRRFVVEEVIVEGDRAALRVALHEPGRAPGAPIPIILEIFRVAEGKVAEIWGGGGQQMSES